MISNIRHNSRGVALLAALFVLMVMSILAIGMLSNVDEDLKISKNYENSERALKIAENGVQIARATFFDPSEAEMAIGTKLVSSVNGFLDGGYFLTYLTSGFAGNETWTQWRYNFGLTGNNTESEITAPLFNVWATNELGVNGRWSSGVGYIDYYVQNIYGVVATGVYFPIEQLASTVDTTIRSHHEYSGKHVADRNVIGGGGTNYAAHVSPFASYTRYKDRATLEEQVLYFTYTGGAANSGAATAPETSSTVRLRAVNVNPNTASAVNATTKKGNLDMLWEFDTGLHGVATAPTVFDPTPPQTATPYNRHRGDEIIYFAVIAQGKPMATASSGGAQTPVAGWNYAYTYPSGLSRTHDFNQNKVDMRGYPIHAEQFPEQIYLFAVVDTLDGYRLKWARPFPDPDVVEWTDYPMEHATGTSGQQRPFVGRPSDIAPYPLEDDFLTDYRDGPGRKDIYDAGITTGNDQQWNQVRGDISLGDPPACSPPVLNVFYQDRKSTTGELTTNYEDATDTSKMNPIIDVYLMYAGFTRGTFLNTNNDDTYPRPMFGAAAATTGAVKTVDNSSNDGWGDPGYRKPNALQTRVIALRDRLVPLSTSPAADIATGDWKWNHPRSRYPEFKWMYRVPGVDPNETDTIPATGYGEYSWDTWFDQQVAPMVIAQAKNSEDSNGNDRRGERDPATGNIDEGAPFTTLTTDGSRSHYPVVYAYYRSQGFPTGGGDGKGSYNDYNKPANGLLSTITFNDGWDDTRIMTMAMRDTWDDYRTGTRTNISGASNANPELSNPVEPYWYYSAYDQASGPKVEDYKYQNGKNMIVYNASYSDMSGATRTAPFPAGVKAGFPRPYAFSESLWATSVHAAAATEEWSLSKQGWKGVPPQTSPHGNPYDADIEGETATVCRECLGGDGLFVLPFNIDLTGDGNNNREDLRLHGINARTGLHVWDYHTASSQAGDNANNTPAIANNKVFMAYMMYDAETTRANRRAKIVVLDATDGSEVAAPQDIDRDADAVILPPTVANGMAYVATYDYAGNNPTATNSGWSRGDGTQDDDDLIRLFALSPIIRLVSTGIYPVGHREKATISNYSSLLVEDNDNYAHKRIGASRRKLQVWVTGDTSRWEELKENLVD